MTDLGFSLRHWLGRRTATIAVGAVALALVASGGCAKQASGPGLGGGGSTTSSTTTTTHTGGSTGTGGMGTGGMASTVSSSSSSTTTSSSGIGGMGGAGMGGAGGAGGMGSGGMGGGFSPPLGSADYPAEKEPNNLVSQANPLQAGTKGFTASIYPLGDVDVFELTIDVGGTSIAVATSDGMGGCPVGAHTYVRLFDSSNNVLAQDDGSNGCIAFNAANTPALIGLPAGNYYVHVESADLSPILFYIVDIRVTPPSCGDSIVQVASGEQCDHGANNGGATDGCSATCQIKSGNYLNETEPNDTQAAGNNLNGYAGGVGQIDPVNDVDWYTVNVTTAGASITAEVGDGFGGCPDSFDSTLSLYSPTMTLLVSDSGGGVNPCSKIAPSVYPAAANLPVGKYALKVERISSQTQSYYVLKVNVAAPGCGDGILQTALGEQCDPGPAMVPGCSATCKLTGDFILETEPNNTPTVANALGTHAGFIGVINPGNDVDCFSFNVPGPSSLVFIQTSDGIGGCPVGFDSVITLYDPSANPLVQDNDGGVGTCSKISPQQYPQAMNLPAGTYSTCVTSSSGKQPLYVVTIAVKQPGCGDGILEAGEQCDDGPANGTPGDGCSATCQAIPPWEIEPNNNAATATPQWTGFSTWKASINPIADHDYFTFTLATAGKVTLTTHDVDMPNNCTSDTVLFLLKANGTTIITSDDDSGPGPGDSMGGRCSQIFQQPVPAGTFFAWVQRFQDAKVIPGYQLDLLVQ